MIQKRFKAVCTETGREFGVDDLLCNGPMKDKCDIVIDPIIGLEYSIEFECAHESKNIELCQSTGLHDANGREVFEGEVIKWDGLNYCCEWDLESAAFVFNVIKNQPGIEMCNLSIDADQVKTSTVIGNRWMSHEQLQEAAEKASQVKPA